MNVLKKNPIPSFLNLQRQLILENGISCFTITFDAFKNSVWGNFFCKRVKGSSFLNNSLYLPK